MEKWIICTGPDWFRPSVTSTRQIMLQFINDGYNLLWVNPIAFKSPSVNSDTTRSMQVKIINKLKTHLKLFKKVDKGIYVFVPVYIPIFDSFWEKFNSTLIRFQLKLISNILGIKWPHTILWISGNFTLSPLLENTFNKKVYQAADLISDFRTNDKQLLKALREKEIYLSKHVDYLFASSPNIKYKLEKMSERYVHLLTHGVNFYHFATKHPIDDYILAIKEKGLPIAGYFGTLSDANDKQVFSVLAENGFSVVIIGKVLGDYSQLKNKPNIYFTGPINFEQLPSFAQGFDVCLLNWIMADWIKNSFPIKSLEYLAMGKPIVSCKIPVIEEMFKPFIYFAETPQEFLIQARLSIKEDNELIRKNRTNAALNHTWDNKYEYIKSTLDEQHRHIHN